MFLFAPYGVFGATRQLVIDTDDYHYEATFDPDRISEARLRELLPLSPYMDIGDGWKLDGIRLNIAGEDSAELHDKSLLADWLEVCIDDDSRYRPCGTRDLADPNFFANAQVNIESNAKALAAIDRLQVPTELRPILEHYRDELAFSAALEQRRLEYLRTADLRLLSRPMSAVDPSKVCAQELQELQRASSLQQRYALSRFSWHTCAIRERLRTSSGYPLSSWRGFLAAYGITERFEFKSVD